MIEIKYDNQDIFGTTKKTYQATSTRGDVIHDRELCVDCRDTIEQYALCEKTVISCDGEIEKEYFTCMSCVSDREKSFSMGQQFSDWLNQYLLPLINEAFEQVASDGIRIDDSHIANLQHNTEKQVNKFWAEQKIKTCVLNPYIEIGYDQFDWEPEAEIRIDMLCPKWLVEDYPVGVWRIMHNGCFHFTDAQKKELDVYIQRRDEKIRLAEQLRQEKYAKLGEEIRVEQEKLRKQAAKQDEKLEKQENDKKLLHTIDEIFDPEHSFEFMSETPIYQVKYCQMCGRKILDESADEIILDDDQCLTVCQYCMSQHCLEDSCQTLSKIV